MESRSSLTRADSPGPASGDPRCHHETKMLFRASLLFPTWLVPFGNVSEIFPFFVFAVFLRGKKGIRKSQERVCGVRGWLGGVLLFLCDKHHDGSGTRSDLIACQSFTNR